MKSQQLIELSESEPCVSKFRGNIEIRIETVLGKHNEQGFSLVELLVVIAIVGILSAISLSLYHHMQVRAFNASAVAYLKGAINAEEALAADGEGYVSCNGDECAGVLPGIDPNPRVTLAVDTPAPGVFVGTAVHERGDKVFEFNSLTGTIVENEL